ncbi:hypothetical protein [Brevundimonas sp. FT23042]
MEARDHPGSLAEVTKPTLDIRLGFDRRMNFCCRFAKREERF